MKLHASSESRCGLRPSGCVFGLRHSAERASDMRAALLASSTVPIRCVVIPPLLDYFLYSLSRLKRDHAAAQLVRNAAFPPVPPFQRQRERQPASNRPQICERLDDCRPQKPTYRRPANRRRTSGLPAYPCRISWPMPDVLSDPASTYTSAPLSCNPHPVTSW